MRRTALASICALACVMGSGAGTALATGGAPTQASQTFTAGQSCTHFTVPDDVTSVNANAIGSAGQADPYAIASGGSGDEVSGTFAVTPDETLDVCVDHGGGSTNATGSSGGGASGVSAGTDFSAPLIVAGGGGGGGYQGGSGGSAGEPQGQQGGTGGTSHGGGGGSHAAPGTGGSGDDVGGGGAASNSNGPGTGGIGASNGYETPTGGGGGGGYDGGGGGGARIPGSGIVGAGGGGGGGSDYCDTALVLGCQYTAGVGTKFGAGAGSGLAKVTLSWNAPVVFSTQGCSNWTVPAGVGSVDLAAVGAAGSISTIGYGQGDEVRGSLTTTPGETLRICVDYGGGGGYSAGGGASGVSAAADFSAPVIVAGGGGGAGFYFSAEYGGSAGSAGAPASAAGGIGAGGGGGTQAHVGAAGAGGYEGTDGAPGQALTSNGPGIGGDGADVADEEGGGGGGGYYGGGGGGDGQFSFGGGGGGGSDYCAAAVAGCTVVPDAGTQNTAGATAGDAEVLIDYGALQAVSFTSPAPDGATVGAGPYVVSATGGGSGNAATFSIDEVSAGVCTIAGATVSFTGAGTCRIDANEAGGPGYDAAPQVSQSFPVAAAPGAATSALFGTDGQCKTVTVPFGATSVNADAVGSAGQQGSAAPGLGDGVSGTFAVSPGEDLEVCVDAGGGDGFGYGGGASGVSVGTDFSTPLIVAGGGGAGGGPSGGAGGNAGYPHGAPGQPGSSGSGSSGGGAGGGASTVGGGGSGSDQGGGSGNASSASGPGGGGVGGNTDLGGPDSTLGGGGGGAGYYGGGGGGGDTSLDGGGGGGGSDYCAALVADCVVTSQAGSLNGSIDDVTPGSAKVDLTFSYANQAVFSAAGCHDWTVPSDVTQVSATAIGASGVPVAPLGGAGDGVSGTLAVTPGHVLDVCVDYGGGSGGGGGASGVSAASDFSAPLLIAGGGGGFSTFGVAGGAAGLPSGAVGGGSNGADGGGGGGTGAVGVAGAGSGGGAAGGSGGATSAGGPGTGGPGGVPGGGGGGAGYYGGGGGGIAMFNDIAQVGAGGGGGGSDYCDTAVVGGCAHSAGAGTLPAAGFGPGMAQVDLAYEIGQTITFTSTPPSGATVGGSYGVSATGGGSGNPVTFSIDPASTGGACSLADSTVSLTGAGTCQVDANQAAASGYSAAAAVSQSFTIASVPAPAGGGGAGGSSGSAGGSSGSAGGGSEPSPVAAQASAAGVTVRGDAAEVSLNCTGSSGESCTVELNLSVVETLKGHELVAVAASAPQHKPKRTRSTVIVGSGAATVAAGHEQLVTVALNGVGLSLLHKRHRLTAALTSSSSDLNLAAQTVTFVLPKRKKKH